MTWAVSRPISNSSSVGTTSARTGPGRRLRQSVHENLKGEPGALVALSGRGDDSAHIVAHAGQPLKPAVDIQRLGQLVDVQPGLAGEIAEKARIDIARAGPHDQPLQRGKPHGRVHRHSVAHRGGAAAPIAEVGRDQAELAGWPADNGGGLVAYEAVAGAVEPVTSHPVPGVPLLRYCVANGVRRHRLVERGVEHGLLRQVG
jgi:hypothetical protein